MIGDKIFSWAATSRGTPKQSPKTYSAGLKTPGTAKTEEQTMIQDEIVSWASTC